MLGYGLGMAVFVAASVGCGLAPSLPVLVGQELLPDVPVTLIEPSVVATELPNHITHSETRQGVQRPYSQAEASAEDVAEIIAFTLSRPSRLAINEVLLRPPGQA